ncbi:hypothetical protein [Nitrospirillum iridis]|uniref:Phasin domain-containing protein n=1 Tax=Nitrospirillum iridis TaxID=765888 RepID=A0A7X0AWV9_9PROT|nr:hypothetical protein [Nitrospirillum iridis]MBB6250796.1 hypothetical protein [Nitrospirillum iridis]
MPDAVKTPFPAVPFTPASFPGADPQAIFGTVLADNAAWLDDVQHVYGRMAHGGMAFFQEVTRFWEQRLHEDREACAAFLTCRTPQELQECGQRFALKASHDYAEAIGRLLQVSIGALEDGPKAEANGVPKAVHPHKRAG